jgi:hypothetical protein
MVLARALKLEDLPVEPTTQKNTEELFLLSGLSRDGPSLTPDNARSVKQADLNSFFAATISRTVNAVAKAANLVTDTALESSRYYISTEELSHFGGLSCDEPYLAPDDARSVNTKVSSSQNEDPLLLFVKKHKDCFKCSPSKFYLWLCSQDMCSLSDLAEACEDEKFVVNDMQANGLKGFKRRPFIKAVNAATGA